MGASSTTSTGSTKPGSSNKLSHMKLYEDLLKTAPDGNVLEVCVGLNWTAVVVEVGGERRCGLASTLVGDHPHGEMDVQHAGELEGFSARELAALVQSGKPTQTSIGAAALNALLPPKPERWVDANASEIIAGHGRGRHVALIGHFPFAGELRGQVGRLDVLEMNPVEGEHPAEAAPEVLPQADVVAITSMTLLNGTFETLRALCAPEALVLLLGPSTPLSPVVFGHGVDILSGSVVTAIEPVLRTVRQGGNFRQVHRAGVRLVTMRKP